MTSEFEEYLRAKEPGKREKAGLWGAAIGLQKVDGLETSAYLAETARRNIEGEISMENSEKSGQVDGWQLQGLRGRDEDRR